ncbi:hypothetical protein OAK35_01030 [Crocinitomicaceae bacterium]|nr:hypothetical protein [Crocinitomicaceae bacterium]
MTKAALRITFLAISISMIISSCSNEESNPELDVLEKMEKQYNGKRT